MFSRIINRIEEAIIALLLAAMTLLVFVEVVLRFGFGQGIMWAQEVTLHLSAWLVLFGVSYGIKVGSHIGVDALVKILPTNVRRVISGIAVIACLTYCGLFMKGAWVLPVQDPDDRHRNGGPAGPQVDRPQHSVYRPWS